jgi:hypothetical protein
MRIVLKFPQNPVNNQIFVDRNGIEWRWKSNIRRWIETGFYKDIPDVSPTNDGLVYNEVIERLDLLDLHNRNFNYSTFKIYPGIDSYYYHFYSPNGLIDIRHDGDNNININVNEQKLYSHYYRILCKGDRGFTGRRGPIGDPGIPSPNEENYLPDREDSTISGSIYVPIPIGTYIPNREITPISLRIYGLINPEEDFDFIPQLNYWSRVMTNRLLDNREKIIFNRLVEYINQLDTTDGTGPAVELTPIISNPIERNPSALLEIDINPLNSTFTFVNNGLNITNQFVKVSFNRTLGILNFEITGNWPEVVIARARQRGPKGDRGDTPFNYITEFICEFPEANVRPDDVLNHFRLDCENDTFYVSYTRLESQDAFSNVTTDPLATITATENPSNGRYIAVEKIVKRNKRLVLFDARLDELEVEDPMLLNWSPQAGRQNRRSFENYKFDWVPTTDLGKCYTDAKWFDLDGAKEAKYPFEIKLPNEPTQPDCCQDEFFIFPESGKL